MSIRILRMTARIDASICVFLVCLCAMLPAALVAQTPRQPQSANTSADKPVASATLPKDYVIGVEDILNVVFWRDKDLSVEVVVRPDGKISVPMLNDVPAAGMT